MFRKLETLLAVTYSGDGVFGVDEVNDLATRMGHIYDEAKFSNRLPEFRNICQAHPLSKVILEDPYSRRAFDKPRGYAGDAIMLDYIYRPPTLSLSPVGAIIDKATTSLPSAQSIIWRKNYIAKLIVQAMESGPDTTILSIASGHMRELDATMAMTHRRDINIWALDQDQSSIDECIQSYPDFRIHPICHSISYILKNKLPPQHFDLIYTAGLSDYLSDEVLGYLLGKVHRSAKPQTSIIVGNFTPDAHGRGFMEGFMDWSLVYRDEAQLSAIVRNALPGLDFKTFRDDYNEVAYIEILTQ